MSGGTYFRRTFLVNERLRRLADQWRLRVTARSLFCRECGTELITRLPYLRGLCSEVCADRRWDERCARAMLYV